MNEPGPGGGRLPDINPVALPVDEQVPAPRPPSEFPKLVSESDFQEAIDASAAAGQASSARSTNPTPAGRPGRQASPQKGLPAPQQAQQHASFAELLRQNSKLTQQLASTNLELERAKDLIHYQKTGYERRIAELEKEVQRLSRLVPSLNEAAAIYPEFAEIASIQRSIRTRLEALKYDKRLEADRASAKVRSDFAMKVAELESNIFALRQSNDQLREEREGDAAQRAMAKELMFLRTECQRLSTTLEGREAAIFSYRCNRESDTAELQRLRTDLAISQRNYSDLQRKAEMLELLLANAQGEGTLAERTKEIIPGLLPPRRPLSAGSRAAPSAAKRDEDLPEWQKEVERRRRSGGRQIQSVADYTDEFISAPPMGKQRPAGTAPAPSPAPDKAAMLPRTESRKLRDKSLEKSLRTKITSLEDENRRLRLSLQLATSNLRSAQLDRQRLLDAPTPIRDILMNCLHDVSYEIAELKQNRIPVGYEKRIESMKDPGARYNYSGLSPQDRDMFLLRLMQYQDILRSASQALLAEESMLLYGGPALRSFSEAVRSAQAQSSAPAYHHQDGRQTAPPGLRQSSTSSSERVRLGTPQEYKLPQSAGATIGGGFTGGSRMPGQQLAHR